MKGGESRLWQRMRDGIKPLAFAQRIENATGEGVPDVILHSRSDGHCAFIELKYREKPPVKRNTPIFNGNHGLRPAQVAWIYERAQAGARIFILGQCENKLWLIDGRFSRELHTFSLEMLNNYADWAGNASRTDWAGIIEWVFKARYAAI